MAVNLSQPLRRDSYAAGKDQTLRHDVDGRMRIEPEKILDKHGIAAGSIGRSLHRSLMEASGKKSWSLTQARMRFIPELTITTYCLPRTI
jgi:hypothetical protein